MSRAPDSALEEVMRDVRAFLCQLVHMDQEEIPDDGALFSAGILDSMSLIGLVGFIEKRCRIKVNPGQLTLQNWDSLERIRRFLLSTVPL